jgi:hypothetical protein
LIVLLLEFELANTSMSTIKSTSTGARRSGRVGSVVAAELVNTGGTPVPRD